jgi:hypothetical protein
MRDHSEDVSHRDVALRLATPADERRLRTLAALDSAPVPAGEVLIAVLDGRLSAAVSIDDGHVIADPFHRTAGLVALLRIRAAQLAARDGRAITTLSALERRSADLRSAKPFAALRRLA